MDDTIKTTNIDTFLNETIIEIIAKFNKQKKRADMNNIHNKLTKIKTFEDITKSELNKKLTMLIVENVITNKYTNNRDSFHVNKDKLHSIETNSLPQPFKNQDVSLNATQYNDLDNTKLPRYSLSPDFNINVRTPVNLQTCRETLNNDPRSDSEIIIDVMHDKLKFDSFKNQLIKEIHQDLEIRFRNEVLSFKSKCEKLVSQSYLNSTVYIKKLEDEISYKNQTINDLITCFQNFTTLLPKTSAATNNLLDNKGINSISSNSIGDILDELNKSLNKSKNDEVENNSILVENVNDNSMIKDDNKTTLDKQLSEIRKKQHRKYQEEQIKIKIPKIDPVSDELITDEKNVSSSSKNNSKSRDSHKWPNETVLVVGDSMLAGVDEKRMSHRSNVKVRVFPGATIDDMFDYINPLLKKCPDAVILHVGTNDCPHDTSRAILDKLLKLKTFILKSLPNSKIVISGAINRTDNAKASLTVKHLNQHLRSLELDFLDNNNIGEECLGRKGLHLNEHGCGKFAINLIKKIKLLKRI